MKFSLLSLSFSSNISVVDAQLATRCTVTTPGAGEEFDECTCSSPEFAGDTALTVTGGGAATVTTAGIAVGHAATAVGELIAGAGDIFRR